MKIKLTIVFILCFLIIALMSGCATIDYWRLGSSSENYADYIKKHPTSKNIDTVVGYYFEDTIKMFDFVLKNKNNPRYNLQTTAGEWLINFIENVPINKLRAEYMHIIIYKYADFAKSQPNTFELILSFFSKYEHNPQVLAYKPKLDEVLYSELISLFESEIKPNQWDKKFQTYTEIFPDSKYIPKLDPIKAEVQKRAKLGEEYKYLYWFDRDLSLFDITQKPNLYYTVKSDTFKTEHIRLVELIGVTSYSTNTQNVKRNSFDFKQGSGVSLQLEVKLEYLPRSAAKKIYQLKYSPYGYPVKLIGRVLKYTDSDDFYVIAFSLTIAETRDNVHTFNLDEFGEKKLRDHWGWGNDRYMILLKHALGKNTLPDHFQFVETYQGEFVNARSNRLFIERW